MQLSESMQRAIAELEALILRDFPSAQFTIQRGAEEPEAILLIATVDIDDPDEVTDLVIERMMQFQIDENLPIFVIPVRYPARVLELLTSRIVAQPAD